MFTKLWCDGWFTLTDSDCDSCPQYIEIEGNKNREGIIFEAIWNFQGKPKSESEAGSVNGP